MRVLVAAFAAFILAAGVANGGPALSSFTWQDRVLLVFSATGDPRAAEQLAVLRRDTAELTDRDLVVLHVSDNQVKAVQGNAPLLTPSLLRADLGVRAASFEVLLVGKDGGVKLRSKKPVSTAELFDLIDRMPMRRSERR